MFIVDKSFALDPRNSILADSGEALGLKIGLSEDRSSYFHAAIGSLSSRDYRSARASKGIAESSFTTFVTM